MHEHSFRLGQQRLMRKLSALNIDQLPISDYTKRYLSDQLRSTAYIGTFTEVLSRASQNWKNALEDWKIVDLGGGTGLQSLLALESGVGFVVYSDIYDISAADAATLADVLELPLHQIIVGDTDTLVRELNESSVDIDCVLSYDVIEHIYDVASHFEGMSRLRNEKTKLFYASGANAANPRYVRQVRKLQLQVENETRSAQWGHKDRDSLQAYLEIRRNMIARSAPDLSPAVVDELASRSRGLTLNDIQALVIDPYLAGLPTYAPRHPTNTCDPLTGNWCEQLLDFDWIISTASDAGFEAKISAGKYAMSGTFAADSVRRMLNVGILLLGSRGIHLAPHYFVSCTRSTSH